MGREPVSRRLRVPEGVSTLLRTLHPELRRKVKKALQEIRDNPGIGKPLRDEVEGSRTYRVSRFRVVYREAPNNGVEVVAVGPRRTIYEETFRLVRKGRP